MEHSDFTEKVCQLIRDTFKETEEKIYPKQKSLFELASESNKIREWCNKKQSEFESLQKERDQLKDIVSECIRYMYHNVPTFHTWVALRNTLERKAKKN